MPLRITLVFRDDPHGMDYAGDVAEEGKEDSAVLLNVRSTSAESLGSPSRGTLTARLRRLYRPFLSSGESSSRLSRARISYEERSSSLSRSSSFRCFLRTSRSSLRRSASEWVAPSS